MAANKNNYIGIKTKDIEETSTDVKITWTPFLRQVFILIYFFIIVILTWTHSLLTNLLT